MFWFDFAAVRLGLGVIVWCVGLWFGYFGMREVYRWVFCLILLMACCLVVG